MEREETTGTENINFTLNTQNGVNKTNEKLLEEEELPENVTAASICSLYMSTEEPEIQVCSNKTEIPEKLSVIEINESLNLTGIDENVCSVDIHDNSTIINIKEDSDKTSENFSENSTSSTVHAIPLENVGTDSSLACSITIADTVHNLEPNHSDSNVLRLTQHSCRSCSCVCHENGSFVNPTLETDTADVIA